MFSTRKQTGFTIIELMVVVAIIGILAAIAIPGYIGYRLKGERNLAWTDLQTLRLLEEQFYAENGGYAPLTGGTLTASTTLTQIQGTLPGFQPSASTLRLYTYTVTSSGGTSNDQNFTATATRASGTDPGSPWTINNNNVTNF